MKEEITLCARLEMVAALVPQGARLIDIGTDHAYLPAALFKRGRIASAWAADVREGPLERARGTLARAGLSAQIGLKRSDGLDGFSAEDGDCIVIAGMGGETIADILSRAPWTKKGVALVLQPQSMIYELRAFLKENGYTIGIETLCRDRGRYYMAMAARGGAWTGESLFFSQMLLEHPLGRAYLQELLRREQAALAGLQKAAAPDAARMRRQREIVRALEAFSLSTGGARSG